MCLQVVSETQQNSLAKILYNSRENYPRAKELLQLLTAVIHLNDRCVGVKKFL